MTPQILQELPLRILLLTSVGEDFNSGRDNELRVNNFQEVFMLQLTKRNERNFLYCEFAKIFSKVKKCKNLTVYFFCTYASRSENARNLLECGQWRNLWKGRKCSQTIREIA